MRWVLLDKFRTLKEGGGGQGGPVVGAKHTAAVEDADNGLESRHLALAVWNGLLIQDECLHVQLGSARVD